LAEIFISIIAHFQVETRVLILSLQEKIIYL